MTRMRKSYSKDFKAKVALEALREEETIQEISNKYEVLTILISERKKTCVEYFNAVKAWKKRSRNKPLKSYIENWESYKQSTTG